MTWPVDKKKHTAIMRGKPGGGWESDLPSEMSGWAYQTKLKPGRFYIDYQTGVGYPVPVSVRDLPPEEEYDLVNQPDEKKDVT